MKYVYVYDTQMKLVFETFEKERLMKLLSQGRDCYRKYQYVYE